MENVHILTNTETKVLAICIYAFAVFLMVTFFKYWYATFNGDRTLHHNLVKRWYHRVFYGFMSILFFLVAALLSAFSFTLAIGANNGY